MAERPSVSPVKIGMYLLLSLLLLGLNQLGWLDWLKRLTDPTTAPVKQFLLNADRAVVSWWEQATNQGSSAVFLGERIATLEAEMISQKAQIDKLQGENQAMRDLLGAPLPASWQFVSAQVVGRHDQMLTINQGQDQGVAVGDPVVISQVFVGEVVEVLPRQAGVRSVLHPDSQTQVVVRKSNLTGKVVVHGGRLYLEEVAVGKGLQPGSLVTRQEDGLVLGEVGKIVSSDQESFQRAEVVWPLEVEALQNVFVVKNN
jgi:cell shape-determining protein MreC